MNNRIPPAGAVTKRGDLWVMGEHRLLCGDCRDHIDVERLTAGRKINVAVTSPPYASQRKYDETSGFKPIHPDEYVDWFEAVQSNVRQHLADDGSWFVNIKEHCKDGQRHLYVKDLTIAHVRRWGWRFVDELCWVHRGLPGVWPGRFKNAWEPVLHFAGQAAIKFRPLSVGHASERVVHGVLAKNGTGNAGWHSAELRPGIARPSNVIDLPNSPRDRVGVVHSAAYPVGLPQFFVRAYSDEGDAIFDPFMGSGTTLIAAHRAGRVAYGTEISPAYCDVIVSRWEKETGQRAVRA